MPDCQAISLFSSFFQNCIHRPRKEVPTCPLIPMFVDSDTVNEFRSEDGAIHVIERRLQAGYRCTPRLLKKVTGKDTLKGNPQNQNEFVLIASVGCTWVLFINPFFFLF